MQGSTLNSHTLLVCSCCTCTCRAVYSVLEKNKKVTKFLNRMLAMGLRDQKLLFSYFSDTLVRPYWQDKCL